MSKRESSVILRLSDEDSRRTSAKCVCATQHEKLGMTQHFCGFDFSRRQIRHQLPIRRQEIVISQFLRQNPRDLLETQRPRLPVHVRCKKSNLQLFRRCRILVTHAPHFRAFRQRDAQLLVQLPRQCRLRRLSLPHLSPRKLPFQRRRISFAPLPNQQPPVLPLNHRCHNSLHPLLCDLCALCGESFFPRPSSRKWSTLNNSRAPSINGGPGVFNNSSRTTNTRRARIAGTSVQASTLYACAGSDFAPVAAHASTITSGRASATWASATFSPAGTTTSPPQIFTTSATHGGELMRGFGQASQYTRMRFLIFFAARAIAANSDRIFRISVSACAARPAIPPNNRISA